MKALEIKRFPRNQDLIEQDQPNTSRSTDNKRPTTVQVHIPTNVFGHTDNDEKREHLQKSIA